MEIEFTKPTPEAAKLQKLFNMTDKEAIQCLMKEVDELSAKLEAWEKCADRLFVHAEEIRTTVNSRAMFESARDDIAEYIRLKWANFGSKLLQ
jgi:hypothetical protein